VNLHDEVALYFSTLPKSDKNGPIKPPDAKMAAVFELICERSGLSPVTRQIYLVNRKGVWTPQTSIDGLRAIADRSPEYQGQAGPFWSKGEVRNKDGSITPATWSDIPPENADLYAAKVGIYRAGRPEPTWGVARFEDYNAGGPLWGKFASTMTAKCAEALALRKAFPAQTAGLYTSEEMAQAEKEGGKRKSRSSLAEESDKEASLEVAQARIAACESMAELVALMRELPTQLQVELKGAYSNRAAELGK
jgi:phage recombination protein Bet